VYALVDPRTAKPRYVGVTVHKPASRLAGHLAEARRSVEGGAVDGKHGKDKWIVALARLGMSPRIHVIQIVLESEQQSHEAYWIWRLRIEGAKLLNHVVPAARLPAIGLRLSKVVPCFKASRSIKGTSS
jgi:hypothetical protein